MVEVIRQEERNDSEERYPWLDDADERKYMTDEEILDKYIDLKDSLFGWTGKKTSYENAIQI